MDVPASSTAAHVSPAPTLPIIVAIGASAGGLDALREFFKATEVDARLAYVVVTHLPSDHASHLAELLDRAGPLRVSEAVHGERVASGRVYVIPPGVSMGVERGVLHLSTVTTRPPAPRPIDHFMATLADDAAHDAVGIVLSGTAHDGTAGLKAIRAAGGLTIVQEPATAQFPGMPESAIDAGIVDQVLPPAQMPAALRGWFDLVPAEREESATGAEASHGAGEDDRLQDVLAVVQSRTGHDFRWYRPAMLRRRLRRRMARTLRGRAFAANATFIALAGDVQAGDLARTRAAGFDHLLVKPAQPERLQALIAGGAVA